MFCFLLAQTLYINLIYILLYHFYCLGASTLSTITSTCAAQLGLSSLYTMLSLAAGSSIIFRAPIGSSSKLLSKCYSSVGRCSALLPPDVAQLADTARITLSPKEVLIMSGNPSKCLEYEMVDSFEFDASLFLFHKWKILHLRLDK